MNLKRFSFFSRIEYPGGYRAFSMIEVLIAMVFLATVIIGIGNMNYMSNKSAMDSYYEFLGLQLAQEPIEIFRVFGYKWLSTYGQSHSLPDYPLDSWQPVSSSVMGGIQYPPEASLFQRKISLKPINGKIKAIRIKVQVAPKEQNRIKIWLSQSDISMEGIVCETPK
ncbi:MAG: hypothetical protein HQM08_06840 [Candidatus Riflebacteria bacterium]|nr:hypothetical protein [Candidatus Riflebacteria bacterium]